MVKNLPQILILFRLFLAITIIAISLNNNKSYSALVLILLYLGILSDIFDGLIARKYQVATKKLRLNDTIADLIFYLAIATYCFCFYTGAILNNLLPISIILLLELLMYLTSLVRFKEFPSPHSILSKFWAIYLIIEFTLIILNIEGKHFTIALWIGTVVHVERLLIYIVLRNWTYDIPSLYHAFLLRSQVPFKKWPMFNS